MSTHPTHRRHRLALLICATSLWFPTLSSEAAAQAFVTGSGNTPGFSVVGTLHARQNGRGRGHFQIIVHRDVPEGVTASAVCSYDRFDDVIIEDNVARFHSVGRCVVLTTGGGVMFFESDNRFTIVDEGEPGPDNDAIDVNYEGASGVAIPGSVLLHGNFIVRP